MNLEKVFVGTIVEESLQDNRFLNELEIISIRISGAENPADRWHLYKVRLHEDQISRLSRELRPEKWYAHFWDDETIYVVYPNKTFQLDRYDKATWQEAIQYGQGLNIPLEQLDFLIDE